jgi:hypothetical protein
VLRRALIVALLLPSGVNAAGDTWRWCVDATGTTTVFECQDLFLCDNSTPFGTIAEAIAAASAVPDSATGERPAYQQICVSEPDTHVESVVIDDADGTIGDWLRVEFRTTATTANCADPAAPPTGAMFDVTGRLGPVPTVFEIMALTGDFSTCAANDRPILRAERLDARLDMGHIEGLDATVVQLDDASITMARTRVQGNLGAVVLGQGALFTEDVELDGNEPPGGTPLIDVSERVRLNGSGIFGNVVRGAPLLRLPLPTSIASTVIAANVAIGAEALLDFRAVTGPASAALREVVLSRNVLTTDGEYAVALLLPRMTGPLAATDCLPATAGGVLYEDRPGPVGSGVPGGGALMLLRSDSLVPSSRLAVLRSFVVENEVGSGGSMIRLLGGLLRPSVAVVHSTFSAVSYAAVDNGLGSPGGTLTSARNLWMGPANLSGSGWMRVEASDDAIAVDVESWLAGRGDAEGFAGRATAFDAAAMRSGSSVSALTHCQRALLNCPDLVTCSGDASTGQTCALDRARAYIPTDALRLALTVPWPWQGDFLDYPSPGGQHAGATGWFCGANAEPFDVYDEFGNPGDSDGFTNVTDCDNHDAGVVPSLPSPDGFDSPYCDEAPFDCYTCPKGSLPPPGDDDSATTGDDDVGDDDSASALADDDDSGADAARQTACRGCGIAFTVEDGRIVFASLPLGLWWQRRRRLAVRPRQGPCTTGR